MLHAFYKEYQDYDLIQLSQRLVADYHEPIIAVCSLIRDTVMISDPDHDRCLNSLIINVYAYVDYRIDRLLPYIVELHKKDLNGHDCRNCKGKCDMQHKIIREEMRRMAYTIRQLLLELQLAAWNLTPDKRNNDLYRTHRYHVLMLEKNLNRLFFLEDVLLFQHVESAQNSIYALG